MLKLVKMLTVPALIAGAIAVTAGPAAARHFGGHGGWHDGGGWYYGGRGPGFGLGWGYPYYYGGPYFVLGGAALRVVDCARLARPPLGLSPRMVLLVIGDT